MDNIRLIMFMMVIISGFMLAISPPVGQVFLLHTVIMIMMFLIVE